MKIGRGSCCARRLFAGNACNSRAADAANRVAGFLAAVLDPAAFIEQQVPQKDPAGLTDGAISVALQLGNLYLLLGFCGLAVFLSTSEVKVVRSYLFALWLGDIGHVAFSSYMLGADKLLRPVEWNAVTWGNIGFTVSLLLWSDPVRRVNFEALFLL